MGGCFSKDNPAVDPPSPPREEKPASTQSTVPSSIRKHLHRLSRTLNDSQINDGSQRPVPVVQDGTHTEQDAPVPTTPKETDSARNTLQTPDSETGGLRKRSEQRNISSEGPSYGVPQRRNLPDTPPPAPTSDSRLKGSSPPITPPAGARGPRRNNEAASGPLLAKTVDQRTPPPSPAPGIGNPAPASSWKGRDNPKVQRGDGSPLMSTLVTSRAPNNASSQRWDKSTATAPNDDLSNALRSASRQSHQDPAASDQTKSSPKPAAITPNTTPQPSPRNLHTPQAGGDSSPGRPSGPRPSHESAATTDQTKQNRVAGPSVSTPQPSPHQFQSVQAVEHRTQDQPAAQQSSSLSQPSSTTPRPLPPTPHLTPTLGPAAAMPSPPRGSDPAACDVPPPVDAAAALDLTNKIQKLYAQASKKGGFSDVYEGEIIATGQKIAIKSLRGAHMDDMVAESEEGQERLDKRLKREMRVWLPLKSPRIVPCLGYARVDKTPCLISPWYANGNAKDYITVNPDCDRRPLVMQIAEGLAYLHNRTPAIVHHDIKSMNVLIDDDGRARLTDFGIAKILEDVRTGFTTTNDQLSAARCSSPEALSGGERTVQSDVYSFACYALEMMTGKAPFYLVKFTAAVIGQKCGGAIPKRADFPELDKADPLWPVMEACWSMEPKDRPTMTEVVADLKNIGFVA